MRRSKARAWVLGRRSLAHVDIASGWLVCPFDLSLPVEFSYYPVRPDMPEGRPKVRKFRDWLFDEIARDEGRGPAGTEGG